MNAVEVLVALIGQAAVDAGQGVDRQIAGVVVGQ
jgi:hypothetical protein